MKQGVLGHRQRGWQLGWRRGRAATLLASVSLAALLCPVLDAKAAACPTGDAPPADVASPATLYEVLSTHTKTQLLAMTFRNKEVAAECAWVYEVKVLTASGSVVELDFDATGLGLIGARGPENDHEAVALVRSLGASDTVLVTGSDRAANGPSSSRGAGGQGSDDGSDDGGGGQGGDGSGEGGDNSGDGGDGGSGSDGSGGEGGDDSGGGGSGSGGSGSGGSGGEGGDSDGGDSGGGDSGSGEGGDD